MAHDAAGKYIGLGVGDSNGDTLLINAKLHDKFQWARDKGATVSQPYTVLTGQLIGEFCARVGLPVVLDDKGHPVANVATRTRLGAYMPPPPPEPSCVAISVNGAGSTWSMGYPYDIGETLDKSRCWHQPIGYDTTPVPMMRGVKTGVDEVIRQLYLPRGARGRNCTQLPYLFLLYSMGAIVGMQVLQRIMDGDLRNDFKRNYMGSIAYGNPMREENHTFPGGIPVDGEGVVTPTMHGTPIQHWDFVSQAGMPGSTGDDMYAKIGGDDNSVLSVENIRAVWKIVATGNPLTLASQIAKLVLTPSFAEVEGAFDAAWTAAQFFIFKGLTPHTTYQFLQPGLGDSRDSWEIGRAYCADLVARQLRAFP
jgi:hypothetical protein